MIARILHWVFTGVLLLAGLYLTLLGSYLVYLGGSFYYIAAGLVTLVIVVKLVRKQPLALLLYALLLGATVVWSMYEAGLTFLSLLPRLAFWMVLGLWFYLPVYRSSLGTEGAPGHTRWLSFAQLAGVALLVVAAMQGHTVISRSAPPAVTSGPAITDWRHYGNTEGGTRFAEIDQINRDNAHQLKEVWRYRTGIEDDFKMTPLQVGEMLYLCGAGNVLIALNAGTGQEVWRYDPNVVPPAEHQYARTCRGISYFESNDSDVGECRQRIVTATVDARMIAVDAGTGERCTDFGEEGEVDLRKGMGSHSPNKYYVTSPPLVAGDRLVVGGLVLDSQNLGLPSGVVRGGKLSVIGNGVVLDPWNLIQEIETIRAQGVEITPETLMIAENAPLILPFHGELDRARESQNSVAKIGTTGRGIGPAYEDKVGRRVIRVADLADDATLATRVDRALVHHNALRSGLGLTPIDRDALIAQLKDVAPEILKYAGPVWKVMNEQRRAGKRILFEGAQGALLDIDFGTYPYVTSSNVIAGQAATGTGIGPGSIDFVLGIVKAYTTRVGEGPFPSELFDEDGQRLGERGHEFGTTTGRKRRCGWFDAVLVRQTCATSGVNGISLTKLDVLDGFETLKICVGYDLDGTRLDYLPTAADQQARCVPIYEEMPGWSESTEGARSWADLPANAIKYVRRVEELIDCPVALLSTSPEREDTILVTDPFAD